MMDETPPSGATLRPLRCEQCGDPVWANDPHRWLTATDPASGEGMPRGLVHEDCWPAWAKAHDVTDEG
jgi:hypothetical protein